METQVAIAVESDVEIEECGSDSGRFQAVIENDRTSDVIQVRVMDLSGEDAVQVGDIGQLPKMLYDTPAATRAAKMVLARCEAGTWLK